jgi:hypothetical protein
MSSCHKKWLIAQGGQFRNPEGDFEVAPSVSYDGEGLADVVARQPEATFVLPLELL